MIRCLDWSMIRWSDKNFWERTANLRLRFHSGKQHAEFNVCMLTWLEEFLCKRFERLPRPTASSSSGYTKGASNTLFYWWGGINRHLLVPSAPNSGCWLVGTGEMDCWQNQYSILGFKVVAGLVNWQLAESLPPRWSTCCFWWRFTMCSSIFQWTNQSQNGIVNHFPNTMGVSMMACDRQTCIVTSVHGSGQESGLVKWCFSWLKMK